MEHNDPQLRRLVKMSKIDLPFDDFEDKVMTQITELEAKREVALKHRKYGLLFFVLGTLFGLGLNYMVERTIVLTTLQPALKNLLIVGCQLCYVLLIVLFSHTLWRLRRTWKYGM